MFSYIDSWACTVLILIFIGKLVEANLTFCYFIEVAVWIFLAHKMKISVTCTDLWAFCFFINWFFDAGLKSGTVDRGDPNDPRVRLKRDCVGILAAFKFNGPSQQFLIVANTHIYW